MGGYILNRGASAAQAGTVTVTSSGPSGAQAAGAVLATLGNLVSGGFRFLDDTTIAAGQVKLNAGGTQLLAATTLSTGAGPAYAIYQAKNGLVTSPAATGNIAIAAVVTTPVNSTAPSISGTPVVGSTLTVVPGVWSGSPTLAYQWYDGTTPISGATGTTYAEVGGDIGQNIKVRETATNSAGSAFADSAAVGPIAAAPVVWYNFLTAGSGVTNGANEGEYHGEAYSTSAPITCNGRVIGATQGYTTTGTTLGVALKATNRDHLNGYVTIPNSAALAQVRLEVPPGRYRLRLAVGSGVTNSTEDVLVKDSTGATILTLTGVTITSSGFWTDTSGTAKSQATWIADNVTTPTSAYVEFVTTTGILFFGSRSTATTCHYAAVGLEYRAAS